MDGATMKVETTECVWDALADDAREAEELRVRSALLYELRKAVKGWNIPHDETARQLGVTGPRLDDLLSGRLSAFSREDLHEIALAANLPLALAQVGAV